MASYSSSTPPREASARLRATMGTRTTNQATTSPTTISELGIPVTSPYPAARSVVRSPR